MPISNPKEEIDARVLRLIGLEDVFDLDYETYLTLLKEAMVKSRMTKKTIPTEEVMLLTEEYKRVRSKKDGGRFEVKKKKISSQSFSIGSVKGLIGGSATKSLPGTSIGASPLSKGLGDSISTITSAIVSITETLKQQRKVSDDASAYDKRKAEQEKRGLVESRLEKRFEGLKKAAEKIIAPVKSLLDRIIQFFTTVTLGRIVYKLVEWLGDPNNASKVKSIIRFLTDWGPALLGGFILFGTRFGKGVRILTRIALSGIAKLAKAIPSLLRFAKGNPKTALALTAGAYATTQLAQRAFSSGNEEPKAQAFAGGGVVNILKFSGGGFNSGGNLFSGFVSGEKGVDKVPAMLSDGEFVMSRGAVEKYGVDTLESMNAAGGGNNKPKVMGGKTYAAGGGMIGKDRTFGYRDSNANLPFSKDPLSAINRFIKFKFGADLSRQSTWGPPSSIPSTSFSGKTSTGSLLTDPVGAVARIANSMGIRTPDVPVSKSKPRGSKPSGQKNMFQEIGEKLKGPGAATYRDAGSIYAKQMLGGFGGPISERDLGKESQQELQKAIQRAKKRTGSEIRKVESEIAKLKGMGAKDGNPALERQKSFLKKLKSGGIRVQYADYADEKGNMSESAKNSKNILGQFWATERSKKEGGGYRVEDKYDFDPFKKKVKDPKTGKMVEKDLDQGELFRDVLLGKGKTTQQRLQAAHLLNPFRGKGDVDMVLGGNRTAAESLGLTGSKTLLGGMLGISGKPKEPKNIGPATMYKPNDPRRKQSGPYQSRFARPKNAGVKPVKPPSKPSTKVVRASPQGGSRGSGSKPSTSRPPSFSASTKGSKTKAQTIGISR
jgi:hypothetical protein